MRRDVFQALADPTRRQIISMLAKQPMHLNAIAENFTISRPAISKHIKMLSECGLIKISKQGRERNCTADLNQLAEVAGFIKQLGTIWNQKLDA